MAQVGDKIIVTYGEQTFCPIQYHSFRVGPFTMETTIQPGEDEDAAFERCWLFLHRRARQAYREARRDFDNNYNNVEDEGR